MKKNPEKIVFSSEIAADTEAFLSSRTENRIFLITDEKVYQNCYPYLSEILEKKSVQSYKIPQGEHYKTLDTLQKAWTFLLEGGADRKTSLVINLGGGIVTDLGAFAASVFKRGIPYINIPTTLLAQADAAAGGKNGVNFQGLKNQIGCFGTAEETIIFPLFTKTLDKREFLNGLAEMLKHALLSDIDHWQKLLAFAKELKETGNIIPAHLLKKTVDIKLSYTRNDRNERGIRAALNFGHTFGHAAEAVYNQTSHKIKHGEAVVAGMVMELFLSHKKLNFDLKKLLEIAAELSELYEPLLDIGKNTDALYEAMKSDKKNTGNQIQSVLLRDIGAVELNCAVSPEEINEATNFYLQLVK